MTDRRGWAGGFWFENVQNGGMEQSETGAGWKGPADGEALGIPHGIGWA